MTGMMLEEIKKAHNLLAEMKYELRPVDRGYANRTLYVNVGDLEIKSKPVSEEMKEKFTGGRGFCLWLLWNAINDDTKWDDPEKCTCDLFWSDWGDSQLPGNR